MKNFFKTFKEKIIALNELQKEYQEKKNTKTPLIRPIKEKEVQRIVLDVPISTILKICFILFAFFMLQQVAAELTSILSMALIAGFLSVGLSPIVSHIESFKVPRPLAILLLYIGFFGVLGVLFIQIIPIIADELTDISYEFKNFLTDGKLEDIPFADKFLSITSLEAEKIETLISQSMASMAENLQGIANSTIGVLLGIFQSLFNLLFTLILLFFILMEREKIGHFVLLLLPNTKQHYVKHKFMSIQHKMTEWFKGQFILMICMGIFMYGGMKFFEIMFGMKYSLTIALLAGIMELFPFVGVLITGLLALVVAVNISWVLVIAVTSWIAIAQFLEGNFLVPLVMEKVVGLSSVVVILVIAMGGVLGNSFGGVPLAIIGMIFAVPLAASIAIFVEDYAHRDIKNLDK